MPATASQSNSTNQKLHQLRQLLNDFESVFSLLNMNPELAKTRDPENNMLPLHTAIMVGAPTTSIMVLLEAYPDGVNMTDFSGNTPFHTGMVPALQQITSASPYQIESDRLNSPLTDLISILNNLDFIIDSFPEVVQQKNGKGNLPMYIFCRAFIPSLTRIDLNEVEQREATDAVTITFEKIYQAYPAASELIGTSTGSPTSMLVGECAIAKSVDKLLNQQTILRLKILIQKDRDGRRLQTLFSLENNVSLWTFFAIFDESGVLKQKEMDRKTIVLDLNKEVLFKKWCLLDIIADFDTIDAANALLQVIVKQKKKLDFDNQHFFLTNEDGDVIHEFISLTKVSNTVRTRIADRAKLSNSSQGLKKWGEEYGRFLRKYRLEKRPKHVSESCVVVFGTEAIKEKDGRMIENPVALKFMPNRDSFCSEVYKRREVDKRKKGDSKYVVPIRASFSSMTIDEFECTKVNLVAELVSYPNIKLKGSDLKYVIVMDCGAGYGE